MVNKYTILILVLNIWYTLAKCSLLKCLLSGVDLLKRRIINWFVRSESSRKKNSKPTSSSEARASSWATRARIPIAIEIFLKLNHTG